MKSRKVFVGMFVIVALASLAAAVLLRGGVTLAFSGQAGADAAPAVAPGAQDDPSGAEPTAAGQVGQLVSSYAAKFVCQAAQQPGQVSYAPVVPLVQQTTEVLIHNPNDYPVVFYKKAVIAPRQEDPTEAPGAWHKYELGPDYAVRENCDSVAQLLTGNPSATFIGTYGVGTKVEGFVVIGIGPQQVAQNRLRFSQLDVTADYTRGSEVLKKDITYQPWWRWWWWDLPWRLGYPYERIVQIDPEQNIDCRAVLTEALVADALLLPDTAEATATALALEVGYFHFPGSSDLSNNNQPALVPLIGNCDKLDATTADIDYVLVSNMGPTDPDPRGGPPVLDAQVTYPWHVGHWYDLAVVTPQNYALDLDHYHYEWLSRRWVDAGAARAVVDQAMAYYFPWWCGWGYWAWWWHGGDCVDIGVGEGESIDVEQVSPIRIFMSDWPPNS